MWGRKKEKAQAGSALCGKEAGMNMSKCTRCAMEQGFDPLNDNRRCIWKAAGTVCPDYDERPDMDSVACEKIPKKETEILRRQMRMLAEKSRFASVTNTAQATETMLKLHRRLTVLPFARFLGIQIFFGIAVGIFAAFSYFIKRAR